MAESSAHFLFGEGLEAVLSLTDTDSFDESPDFSSMVSETSSEMQTEEPEADSNTECSKTFNTSRGLQRHHSKHQKKRSSRF